MKKDKYAIKTRYRKAEITCLRLRVEQLRSFIKANSLVVPVRDWDTQNGNVVPHIKMSERLNQFKNGECLDDENETGTIR